MKKLSLFFFATLFGVFTVNAQENNEQTFKQTSKGKWLIEANTGSSSTGNTSFSLSTSDGSTDWSVGLEGGYFFMDDLAVKAGLGYTDKENIFSAFVYKVGVKYYLASKFPLGIDFTGTYIDIDAIESSNDFYTNDRGSWLGVQGGYAWFLGSNVSIEPALRYSITLDDSKAKSVFQALIGFALHF